MEEINKSNEKRKRVSKAKPVRRKVVKLEKNENEGTPIRKNQIIKKQNALPKETKKEIVAPAVVKKETKAVTKIQAKPIIELKDDFVFKKENLKIIPLGGIEEIGKNITVFEYGNDMILVDCGVAFPEDDMLGIDLVIPDFSYLEKNKEKLRGLVITHGH